MYHATFRPYDSNQDRMQGCISLVIPDEAIEGMIAGLSRAQGPLRVTVLGRNHDVGEKCQVQLDWSASKGGFSVSTSGQSAGFIPLDELEASLGHAYNRGTHLSCQVRLHGDFDVVRRGYIDVMKGAVYVYTKARQAACLGATVYVDDLWQGSLDLWAGATEPGNPAKYSLRLPSPVMYELQDALGVTQSSGRTTPEENDLDQLASFTREFETFIEATSCRVR